MLNPKEVVKKWVDAFNAGDADRIAGLYDDNAINHQVANEPVIGASAIREMFVKEFAMAEMVCIVENIFKTGNGLSWNGKIHWDCADAGFSRS